MSETINQNRILNLIHSTVIYLKKKIDNSAKELSDIKSIAERKDIDVFLIAGQSNAVGKGNRTLSPNPTPNTVYQYYNDILTQVTDEVGLDPINPPSSNYGSAWPSFGITWNNMTGRKICFIPTAYGGTSQVAASETIYAPTDYGNWSPTGTLWYTSVNKTKAAIQALRNEGFNPIFRGVLWCQGETDGLAINSAVITQNDYQTGLINMIANYRTEFGARMPFYIFRIGTKTSVSDVGYAAVRASQVAVADADSFTKIVFYNAINFQARGLMMDDVHYTQVGYNEMGQVGAENILRDSTYNWQRQGIDKIYYDKGNVGIGTQMPNSSALLELSSTTQGFLPTRMTQVQRDAIVSPTEGLMIYQNDGTKGWYGYNGTTWVQIG